MAQMIPLFLAEEETLPQWHVNEFSGISMIP